MPAIIEEIKSDIAPVSHERDSEAYRQIKDWKPEVPFDERAAGALIAVDSRMVEQQLRAYADSFRELCFRDEAYGKERRALRIRAKQIKGRAKPAGGFWLSHLEALYAAYRQRCVETLLEEAAKAGNETAFLSALKEVNWHGVTASEYVRIIDLALEAGALLAARRIAFEGLSMYRDNQAIQEYARVLAPPNVTRIDVPPDTDQGVNLAWLKDHAHDYRGRWVAIRGGRLLDVADSYKELVAKIGETRGTDILVTRAF